MPEPTTCKHCGARIVSINYSTGPEWMHQPAGASFHDGVYRYCHKTRAEPEVLVVGLCGNREDHEPHRVESATVTGGGPFWCCADQTQRLPYKLDQRPHSRACGWRKHDHGVDCSSNCPTCGGKEMTAEPAHVCVFKLVVGDPTWKCEKCGKTMSAEELQELLDRQQ